MEPVGIRSSRYVNFMTPFVISLYWNNLKLGTRDVSTGATGATEVAPKFSDTLTLSPPWGADFAQSQRSQLKFPRGYIPDIDFWMLSQL